MLDLSTISDDRIHAESSRRLRRTARLGKFREACYLLIRQYFQDETTERHLAEVVVQAFGNQLTDYAETAIAAHVGVAYETAAREGTLVHLGISIKPGKSGAEPGEDPTEHGS